MNRPAIFSEERFGLTNQMRCAAVLSHLRSTSEAGTDREKMARVRWMQPRIVAEIAFNERTPSGHLRHAKFLRVRERTNLRSRKDDGFLNYGQSDA